jgi:hypothetical protein
LADTVLDMAGHHERPDRLGPFSLAMIADWTMAPVVGPPEPATRPVRAFEISASPRPASAIASFMARYA